MKYQKPKLKVGILMDTTLDSNDGVQQYVKALGRWLIKNRHDVKFLVGESKDEGEFKGRIINIGKTMDIKSNGNKLSPAIIPKRDVIKETIEKENFDILHLQMPYSPSVSGYLIRKSSIPVVGTFHILPNSSLVTLSNYFFAAIVKNQVKKFRKVMAVSPSAKEFFDKVYGQNSVVIPNMVDLEKFNSDERLEKYNDQKVNILFFGRLVDRKGAPYLLKAIKILKDQIGLDNFRVLIAGEGQQREMLKNFAKTNELNNVEFLGYIDENDKTKVYNTSDICVFPATGGESFGIVLIEAMAAGKPVLAFDNPGYRSVMEQTQNQKWIVANKNVKKLAKKLKELIENKEIRKAVSENNKREVKQFEVDTVCKQIMDIYQDSYYI